MIYTVAPFVLQNTHCVLCYLMVSILEYQDKNAKCVESVEIFVQAFFYSGSIHLMPMQTDT